MCPVRHGHGRRTGVAIDRDHFAAVALQFNHDFLAELTGAQQHHACARRRQRRTDYHCCLSLERILCRMQPALDAAAMDQAADPRPAR